MDLSIIIPCHNLEPFINNLLNSLLIQHLHDYKVQLIFVLDNCNDKTQETINASEIEKKYHVLILKSQFNSCGLARNKGFEYAVGKYIWFVDGDDWLLSRMAICYVIDAMERTRSDYLQIDYDYDKRFGAYGYFSMVWQYIFKKEAIEHIKFRNIQPCEDDEFMREFFINHREEYKIMLKLYYYNYMREGSNMYQYRLTGKIEP